MLNLKVKALYTCSGDPDKNNTRPVLMEKDQQGVVCGFVTFKKQEVHAVVILDNGKLVSIDIDHLQVVE